MSSEELVLDDTTYKFYIVDDVLSIRFTVDESMNRTDIDIRRIIATESTTVTKSNQLAGVVIIVLGFLFSFASYYFLRQDIMVYLGVLLVIVGLLLIFYKQKRAVLNIDVEGEEPYSYSMNIEDSLVHGFQDKINEKRRQLLSLHERFV